MRHVNTWPFADGCSATVRTQTLSARRSVCFLTTTANDGRQSDQVYISACHLQGLALLVVQVCKVDFVHHVRKHSSIMMESQINGLAKPCER